MKALQLTLSLLLIAGSLYFFIFYEASPQTESEPLKKSTSLRAKIRGLKVQNQILVSQLIDSLKVGEAGSSNDKILEILHYKTQLPPGFEELDDLKVLEVMLKELEKKNNFLSKELISD